MPTALWRCDTCLHTHPTHEAAETCEQSHTDVRRFGLDTINDDGPFLPGRCTCGRARPCRHCPDGR